MKRIREKGAGFVENEVQRINQLLLGKVVATKRKELTERLNILKAFAVPKPNISDEL